MFYRFREALARFMYGRYGSDQLNRFLIVIFFVVFIANIFARNRVLWIVVSCLLSIIGPILYIVLGKEED